MIGNRKEDINNYSIIDMEYMNHIKARIKARKAFNKKKLRNIRLMMAKEEKFIWILLLVALIFPVLPFSKLGIGKIHFYMHVE